MLSRFIVLFLIIVFASCDNKKTGHFSKSDNNTVIEILEASKNKKINLQQRLKLIDSAFMLIKENSRDSISLATIASKSSLHYKLNQKDSSFLYDSYLLNKSREQLNEYYLGNSHFNIAIYFKKKGVYDSAFYHYNQSKNFFFKQKKSRQVGKCLLGMALIQKNQNDFFGSKETLTEALQYLHTEKDKKYIASSYSTLGTNHRKLLNFEEAVKYFNYAIDKAQSKKDELAYKNNLAATYIDYKKYNDAITILEQIKVDTTLKRTSSQYARILDNLAYANWLAGEKISEKEFIKPLKIRIANKGKRGQIASYTHLGEFYSKANPRRSEAYFDSVIGLSKAVKIPRAEKDALKFLIRLQPNSVILWSRYAFLQDSLYEQELKVSTKFAKYKYDDKVIQEENSRLEKENVEKELEASQQRNQKTFYLAGLIFIAAVLGLSFFGFRQRTRRLQQKSKTDKLEAVLETEAELSRKLHDDHGGKLNQAMLLVERDADKTVVLDKLESVYKQTRDFSREINSVATGPNYWEELKATLEYSKPIDVELIFNGAKELDWSIVGHQTKTILFKVLHELVINMARHSKASQTVILFKEEKKNIVIYYEDNGVGASKESLLRKNGLRNTEKRIQAIEGSITFDSEEGKGFRAEIQIPK